MTIERAVPIRSIIPARLGPAELVAIPHQERLRRRPHRVGLRGQGGGQVPRDRDQAAAQRQLEFRKECRWLTRS
jgi:hypothetical protein